MEKLTYTVQEVAELLSISLPKAYDLTNRQDFPTIRIGRKKIVAKKEFHEWVSAESRGEHVEQ